MGGVRRGTDTKEREHMKKMMDDKNEINETGYEGTRGRGQTKGGAEPHAPGAGGGWDERKITPTRVSYRLENRGAGA